MTRSHFNRTFRVGLQAACRRNTDTSFALLWVHLETECSHILRLCAHCCERTGCSCIVQQRDGRATHVHRFYQFTHGTISPVCRRCEVTGQQEASDCGRSMTDRTLPWNNCPPCVHYGMLHLSTTLFFVSTLNWTILEVFLFFCGQTSRFMFALLSCRHPWEQPSGSSVRLSLIALSRHASTAPISGFCTKR